MKNRAPRPRHAAIVLALGCALALAGALALFLVPPASSGSGHEAGSVAVEASPARRLAARLFGEEESPRARREEAVAAMRLAWADQIRERQRGAEEPSVEEAELPPGVAAARARAEEQRVAAEQARAGLFQSNLGRLEEAASEAEEQGDASRAAALRLRMRRLRARQSRESGGSVP